MFSKNQGALRYNDQEYEIRFKELAKKRPFGAVNVTLSTE